MEWAANECCPFDLLMPATDDKVSGDLQVVERHY